MNTTKSPPVVPAFQTVSAALVPQCAPRPRIIDVREPVEFSGELGHIPGAELVPLGTLEVAARGWARDAPLMVVCRSGARSARAAAILLQLGFRDVVNVEGGTQAYLQPGLPVDRG
jgi:rhodanese-related sulfurtransferase